MHGVGCPETLWVMRHGQSAGNVAREEAEARGLHTLAIATRDIDTPLSELGRHQAWSVGHWFAQLPAHAQPEVLLCSPYVRARQTAELLMQSSGLAPRLCLDERLREKEFGLFDQLTHAGIASRFPDLHAQRSHVGKFYFRPPGGESWCDVILRLRSVWEHVEREYAGCRVLVVAHQVIVNCMRYLLEDLDEARILAIDRRADVPNCGITAYERHAQDSARESLRLVLENFVAPLSREGTPVTRAPDEPAAPGP